MSNYCGNCVFLSLTEKEQNDLKMIHPFKPLQPHICRGYGKRVKHMSYDPRSADHDNIVALKGCHGPFGSYQDLFDQRDQLHASLKQLVTISETQCPICGRIRGHHDYCVIGKASELIDA